MPTIFMRTINLLLLSYISPFSHTAIFLGHMTFPTQDDFVHCMQYTYIYTHIIIMWLCSKQLTDNNRVTRITCSLITYCWYSNGVLSISNYNTSIPYFNWECACRNCYTCWIMLILYSDIVHHNSCNTTSSNLCSLYIMICICTLELFIHAWLHTYLPRYCDHIYIIIKPNVNCYNRRYWSYVDIILYVTQRQKQHTYSVHSLNTKHITCVYAQYMDVQNIVMHTNTVQICI